MEDRPLTVKEIELREIRLPLKEPFKISSGEVETRRICLVRVWDVDGSCGWGECVAGESPSYSPETVDTAWLAIRQWIAPRVIGHRFSHPRLVSAGLDRNFRGHQMAKAAVEMACWELAAETRGVALASLLGGTQKTIPVGISLGIQKDPETLVEKAQAAVAEGYRKIKIKVEPGSDLHYLGAVRLILGSRVAIMADANSAYRLEDLDHLRRFDPLALMMIEQPLASDDLVRHARLQKELKTPICLDESITGLQRAEDMITLGSGRIINIKPGRVGGFSASIAIHDLCARHDIPVWCGGMLESGVGRAHNVALASLPHFLLPGDISPSSRYWEQDIVTPEWTMDTEGRVTVPFARAGMGVAVDMDRVDDLTVRHEVVR